MDGNATAQETSPHRTGTQEYQDIFDAATGRGRFATAEPGDVYQHLLGKERRVLDTVDRVVNDARLFDAERTSSIFKLPLHVICMRLIATIRMIMDDILEARSPTDVVKAFFEEERKMYVGMLIVLAALLVLVIDCTL